MLTFILALLIGVMPSGAVVPVDGPSGIPGLSVSQLEADAAQTLEAFGEPTSTNTYVFVSDLVASYDAEPTQASPGYYWLESTHTPGLFHVFHVTAALKA